MGGGVSDPRAEGVRACVCGGEKGAHPLTSRDFEYTSNSLVPIKKKSLWSHKGKGRGKKLTRGKR